jgi:hypothetical protein
VGALVLFALRKRIADKLRHVILSVNVLVVSVCLGIVYMYTSQHQFFVQRSDRVWVVAPIIVSAALVFCDVSLVGALFHEVPREIVAIVLGLTALGESLVALASFSSSDVQWPGFFFGLAFWAGAPTLLFVYTNRKQRANALGTQCGLLHTHAATWLVCAVLLRVFYAVVQLTGHSFGAAHGLGASDELVLYFVLHLLTLAFLAYTARFVQARKRDAKGELANGARRNGAAKHAAAAAADADLSEASFTGGLLDSTSTGGGSVASV